MTTRSERLKESRLKAGLSQKQIADAVGMKQPSYSYLEKNDNASSNGKYRDKIISAENGANFRVIGRQFWRAG